MAQHLKHILTDALKKELPGARAHNLMLPTAREDSFRFPVFEVPPQKSAVLFLFYLDEESIKFPLIQRPTYDGAHSGQIGLPGGKQEKTDADLIQTALREAREEIGIEPNLVEIVGCLSNLHIAVSNFVVTPVIGFVEKKPDYSIDPVEVESLIETDLSCLFHPSHRKQGTVLARGKFKIQTPYFDIDNKIVWGATAMMLSELVVILSEAGYEIH